MGDQIASLVDRLSELPDFILHHVLSFLSARESARTCILSKRWQHILETFPILDLNEYIFELLRSRHVNLERNPEDEQQMIHIQREKFMNYVDYRLQRYQEGNLRMKKFLLHMNSVNIELLPRIDSWLELVSHLEVQELDLRIPVEGSGSYSLPLRAVASQSLAVLRLLHCEVSQCVNDSSTKLQNLVVVVVAFVSLEEESVRNLLSRCPLMEEFSLIRCRGSQRLKICGHNKLKKIKFYTDAYCGVEDFSIEIPSLEEFEFSVYDSTKLVCDFSVSSACQNLKKLSLEGIPIRSEWLQQIITPFPRFEFLKLTDCYIQDGVVRLSSTTLKELYLVGCKNLMEGHLDTPNLQVFDYNGFDMPLFSMKNETGRRRAILIVKEASDIDYKCFVTLNKFVSCGKFQDLRLIFLAHNIGDSICFDVNDRFGSDHTVPFELQKLRVDLELFEPINCSALLDGLLCNLHPKILFLNLNIITAQDVQKLFDRMVFKNPKESPDNHKCWRNLLKDIECTGIKGTSFNIRFDPDGMELLKSICEGDMLEVSMTECLRSICADIARAASAPGEHSLYFNLLW